MKTTTLTNIHLITFHIGSHVDNVRITAITESTSITLFYLLGRYLVSIEKDISILQYNFSSDLHEHVVHRRSF